ncbi:MAG: DUF1538 domain-containing protein [Peptococcaceae bacterium]|nr:DUF1538 domain-containing protein [Peptococcaceae bacterium]
MNEKLKEKLKEKISESLSSVLPITAIVLLMSFTVTPMPVGTLILFLLGAFLLIVGMGFFSLGVDMAMLPIGEGIGVEITKTKRIGIALLGCLITGCIVTIAEPDLQVLANQVPAVPNMTLVLVVSAGVGFFLMVALLRILFRIRLSHMLIGFYAVVFLLAVFAPAEFIAVAFDSGGVTTGPITVPFIMALGIGMAMLRSDKDSHDDSFGLVALCSIGPILAVLLLSLFYDISAAEVTPVQIPEILTTQDASLQFAAGLPAYIKEVLVALLPVLLLFLAFQFLTRRFRGNSLARVMVGLAYTYIGLVTFLTGVNVGFMPAGNYIGRLLATSGHEWLLVPLGMLIGYFLVSAEPAVHVLTKQVEEISNGAISAKSLYKALSLGMCCSVGLAMLRLLTGISIFWFLVPGYAIALVMTFFVPRIFTAIAFDSGGVASGPMTATFLLPFAMGACEGLGGNILTDAFGIVAMVAMTPLIAIQILSFVYKRRMQTQAEGGRSLDELAENIIYYEEDF